MADRRLGAVREEFRTDSGKRAVVGWSALALGAVAVAVGVPLLLGQADEAREGFGPTLIPGLLLGVGLAGLVVGGVRVWQAVSRPGESFALREHGLVHHHAEERTAVFWEDVARVRDQRARGPELLGSDVHCRIDARDGGSMLITGYTEEARRLADAVAEAVGGGDRGRASSFRAWWWPVGAVAVVLATTLGAAAWGHAQREPIPGFEADDPRACRYFSESELEELRLDEGYRLPQPVDERIVDACRFGTRIVSSMGGVHASSVVVHVWDREAAELAEEFGFTARSEGADVHEAEEISNSPYEVTCSVLYEIADARSVSVQIRLGGPGMSTCEESLPDAVPHLLGKLP
ncbi:hypothetical protein [Streptomyces profundus]|uniref:hypothetical protein n=1 Tax=Streptomyces profundus TaxID=2867410 RepID=UPI001D168309|nr:hypothetical protein [Streptomyces sp. MA3_2.13]UED85858.1 hypothetical protein K4G22_18060 [Streptomyces sp. MA3_2.13]